MRFKIHCVNWVAKILKSGTRLIALFLASLTLHASAHAQKVLTTALEAQGTVLAAAPVASLLPAQVLEAAPLPGDESIRARLKACLLMGEMNCVVEQYLLLKDIGRMPGWLVAFQNAFAVANRRSGECAKVANAIHEGLSRFGEKPEYIRFTVEGRYKLLAFDEIVGGSLVRSHQLAVTGNHIAIRLEGRILDAYTGLAGLPLKEYLSRLVTHPTSRIAYEVVSEP